MDFPARSARIATMAPAASRVESLASPLVMGLCLTVLAAAFVGCVSTASTPGMSGLAVGLALLACASWVGRSLSPRHTCVLFCLYAVLLLAWALNVSSEQSSDFGVYFRCGADSWKNASSLRDWTRLCQGAWLPGNPTYWRRSLLYTLPIGMLGSGSYLGLKLANLVLHALATFWLYRVVRPRLGAPQAFTAAAALALYPEYWFTTSLATSDNLVVLLLVVWLHLLTRCLATENRRWEVVLAALLVVALDLLRDIGIICVLTTMLIALISNGRTRLRLVAMTALSFGAMIVAGALLSHLSQTPIQETGLVAKVVSIGITNTHSWIDAYRWSQYLSPLLPAQERSHYLAGLLALDLQNGVAAALHNWMQKIQVLFQGNGYYLFTTSPFDNNPDSVRIATGAANIALVPAAAVVLSGVAAAYAVLALIGMPRVRTTELGKVSIAFCCAFVFLVIGFGEVQPRYAVLLGPVLGILIAGISIPRGDAAPKPIRRSVQAIALCMAMLCGGFFVVVHAASHYLAGAPAMTFQGQEQAREQVVNGVDCNAQRATVDITDWYIRIAVPPGRPACYTFVFSVAGTDRKQAYFLARDPAVPRWQTPTPSPFDVSLTPLNQRAGEAAVDLKLGSRVALSSGSRDAISGSTPMRLTVNVDKDTGELHALVFGYLHDDAGYPVKLPSRH